MKTAKAVRFVLKDFGLFSISARRIVLGRVKCPQGHKGGIVLTGYPDFALRCLECGGVFRLMPREFYYTRDTFPKEIYFPSLGGKR